MKRDPLDALFSKLIRARDRYTCQRCGTTYPSNSAGLHCSHHYTRTRKRTRWTPLNAAALCYPCHSWYGGNPDESAAWLAEYLGPGALEELRRMQTETLRIKPGVKDEIYRVLKEDSVGQQKVGPGYVLRDPVAQLRAEGVI